MQAKNAWFRIKKIKALCSIIHGVRVGEHARTQDPRNKNPATLSAVKHEVFAMLQPAQTWPNIITLGARI